MNRFILILVFISSFINLKGQESNWFFSLNMGSSKPLGTYTMESDELKDGFAENGFTLSLEASYALNHNVSLKGIALLNTNTVNRLPLWNKLVDRMNGYFQIEADERQFLSMDVDPWVTNGILFGPVYTFLIKNFQLDFQALGGFNVAYLPQPLFMYENPDNNWKYFHRNLDSRSFSYGLLTGTSLRFPMSERFDLRFGVNYFLSKAKGRFEEVRITEEGATSVTDILNTGESNIPIKMLTGTIGFVYYLR